MKRALLAFVALLYALVPALSQTATRGWVNTGTIQLAVTGTTARVAAPGSGQVFYVQNVGSNTAYVNFGGATVTAIAASTSTVTPATPILAGQCAIFSPINATFIAAITASSTTTLDISQGDGFPACGGASGSGGGGGGGAVTIADCDDTTQGCIGDTAATAGSTGTTEAKLRLMTSQLNTISTNTGATPSGSATSTLQTTGNTSLATIATNSGLAIPAGTAHIGTVGNAPYADGATPYTASATGTTAATTATLAASGGATTTYICGFSIRANATAATTNNATVTGTISGTLNFTQWTAPNASGLGITEMIFSPCVPASASNTAIAVVSGAPGTGGVVSVTAWGYKL